MDFCCSFGLAFCSFDLGSGGGGKSPKPGQAIGADLDTMGGGGIFATFLRGEAESV